MTDDAVLHPPPVPPEADLRDFTFMPVDVRRLLTSETWVLGRPEEKVAALNLWCEAWHQVPAGSLPNNDRMLIHLSQAGTGWPEIREHAMRGWKLHADNRWYHAVITEKVLDSWERKLIQRERSRKGNAKRWSRTDPAGKGGGVPEDPAKDPEGAHKPAQAQADGPATAVQLAVAMRLAGVSAHSYNPEVIKLAEQGVSVKTAVAACEQALAALPGQVPPVGYVTKILASWSRRAAETSVHGAQAPPPRGATPSALERQAEVIARITGGSRQPNDSRTIDAERTEPAAPTPPRLAASRG